MHILSLTVNLSRGYCSYDPTGNCSPQVNNVLRVAKSNVHFPGIILFELSGAFDAADRTFPLKTLYYFLILFLLYRLLLLSLFCRVSLIFSNSKCQKDRILTPFSSITAFSSQAKSFTCMALKKTYLCMYMIVVYISSYDFSYELQTC